MAYREGEALIEADRSLLVVGVAGKVIGLERDTGQLRWRNDLRGGGTGEVFIAFRYGALVVSANGDAVFRLDYATGATLWQARTQSVGRATIAIEPEVIVVAKSGYLDAFRHDGHKLWTQPLTGMGVGATALGFPGNVAQADDAGSQ